MDFSGLQERLVAAIRERVRRGELTERRLAHRTGLSQPHIHNVLKGLRVLSTSSADHLLDELHIDLRDLCDGGSADYCRIPALAGHLGPGHCYPALRLCGTLPFLASHVARLHAPAVVRAAADADMEPLFGAGDFILLDHEERKRCMAEPDSFFAVNVDGEGLIRHVRRSGGSLFIGTQGGSGRAPMWDCISLADRHILDIVKAKVVWIGHHMEPLTLENGPTEEAGEISQDHR